MQSISTAEELQKEICEEPLMITQLQTPLQDAPAEDLVPVHTDADIWAPATVVGMADAQLHRILITRLVSLPLSHRLVFNLFVIDGYPTGEVARLSGMRVKRVERYLSEARSMLR